jgi:hypothetical protein
MFRCLPLLASALLLVPTLSACGSRPPNPVPVAGAFAGVMDGAPEWVLQGCEGSTSARNALCGVGTVQGTRNLQLARSTAQARGRTEIARILNVHVQAMLEDYQATVTGGDQLGIAADDEQLVTDVARHVTDISLVGVRQVDTWVSRDGSSLFVLMMLDAEAVHTAISSMDSLSPQIRAQVEASSRRAFDRLDAQLAP